VTNAYVTLWTKARCGWLQRVRDHGPLQVLFGGPHTSLPSLAHVRVGDTVFPVWVSDGQLRVIAKVQVAEFISLHQYISDYLKLDPSELGVGPISPEFPRQHPELGHRAPFGCIEQIAIGVEGCRFNFQRSVPPRDLPLLTFGPKPGKEQPLKGIKDGRLTSILSLQGHVRRASEQSREILAAACDGA
jgi:hypothetical protein